MSKKIKPSLIIRTRMTEKETKRKIFEGVKKKMTCDIQGSAD